MKMYLAVLLTCVYCTPLCSQTHVSVGLAGASGAGTVSTGMVRVPNCTTCGTYGSGSGSSETVNLEAYLRSGASSGMHFISLLSVSRNAARSGWRQLADRLPFIDSAGNIGYSETGYDLSFWSSSTGVMLGAGVESGSLSLLPILRVSFVSEASTINRLQIIEPASAVFSPEQGAEYEDGGRTLVLERISTSGHTSTLLDAGLLVGYTLTFSLAGVDVETALQVYAMRGLTSLHRNWDSKLSYEAGGRLFLGIRL